jgi:hypothetical protein
VSIQVSANNRIYSVVNDLPATYQVLIGGVVTDELTGEAPAGALTVSLGQKDAAIKSLVFINTLGGGLFCLAGEVGRVFPHLGTTAYSLELQMSVPGYKDASLSVAVPQNSTFPLLPYVTVKMQRLPVRIQGRVVGLNVNVTAIHDAQVIFVDEPYPPTPLTEHAAALRMPLHSDHRLGAKVRQRQLDAVGAVKQLAEGAPLDGQTLTLRDQTGLAAGDVLLVGTQVTGEYVVVDSLPPQVPGQVLLRSRLNRSYAVGTAVQKYTPGAIGADTALTQQALASDGVLFLQTQLPVDTIEIEGDTAALVEYSALGAITDADGYYLLDGINRVRTVYIEASATGYKPMTTPTAWTIDYTQPVNVVDFRLHP